MAKVITSYAINSDADVAYSISAAATAVFVALKDAVPTVWYEADPEAEDAETKTFAIFADGDTVAGTYVGSYFISPGDVARHIYVA